MVKVKTISKADDEEFESELEKYINTGYTINYIDIKFVPCENYKTIKLWCAVLVKNCR